MRSSRRWPSRIHKNEMQFRISGGAVNVARFLSGRPDCFAARVRSNQVKDLRSRKVLRMVVNVGARGAVSPDTFFARGAAAVTLIEALERAGVSSAGGHAQPRHCRQPRHAEGAARLSHQGGGGGRAARQAGVLPRPPGPAPQVELRLRLKHAGWIGGSIDVPLDERGDIYIDAADSTATSAWLDPVKAQAWVLAQLKAQGIVMRAA